jgi:hypothetical protein
MDGTRGKPKILHGTRPSQQKAQIHYNNILIMSSTCHLRESTWVGRITLHPQPLKLDPIDNDYVFTTYIKICIYANISKGLLDHIVMESQIEVGLNLWIMNTLSSL